MGRGVMGNTGGLTVSDLFPIKLLGQFLIALQLVVHPVLNSVFHDVGQLQVHDPRRILEPTTQALLDLTRFVSTKAHDCDFPASRYSTSFVYLPTEHSS